MVHWAGMAGISSIRAVLVSRGNEDGKLQNKACQKDETHQAICENITSRTCARKKHLVEHGMPNLPHCGNCRSASLKSVGEKKEEKKQKAFPTNAYKGLKVSQRGRHFKRLGGLSFHRLRGLSPSELASPQGPRTTCAWRLDTCQ